MDDLSKGSSIVSRLAQQVDVPRVGTLIGPSDLYPISASTQLN